MEELEVLVALRPGALLPGYATSSSSGVDLHACLDEPVTMNPLERALVSTGIFVSIPEGYEAEVRPRSGIANKYGVTVLNSPGTIDADYRGEVKVLLINLGQAPFVIQNGDRIAQMVFKNVTTARWRLVDTLPRSDRGEGGFGSTGLRGLPDEPRSPA
jgi:dUTP pyrophosphatase